MKAFIVVVVVELVGRRRTAVKNNEFYPRFI
jgi:hypothetical protein